MEYARNDDALCVDPHWNQKANNAYQQQAYQNAVGASQALTKQAESLASVAPRVISLAMQIREQSAMIQSSFGLGYPNAPAPAPSAPEPPPNLMNQLQRVENILRMTAESLEETYRHING